MAPLTMAKAEFPLNRVIVYDKLFFYYAFGNTPPTYLFPGLSSDDPSARVLLLGCGDIRSTLYSLFREYHPREEEGAATKAGKKTKKQERPNQKVHFTLDDYCPHVIARNILLLRLIMDCDVTPETLFAVWFSTELNSEQHRAVVDACNALYGFVRASDVVAAMPYLDFVDVDDWPTIREIFRDWSTWRISKTERERMRDEARRLVPDRKDWSETGFINGLCMQLWNSEMFSGEVDVMRLSSNKEVEAYVKSGGRMQARTVQDTRFEHTNPTLYTSRDKHTLHYGSFPFLAFPLFRPKGTSRAGSPTPITDHCVAQLGQWMDVARSRQGLVTWRVSTEHCVTLCARLRSSGERFLFIDSSNVSDHIGLMPILLSSRWLLRSDGMLQTQSLIHENSGRDALEFLADQLALPSSFWPSALSLRCLGYEDERVRPEVPAVEEEKIPDMKASLFRSAVAKGEMKLRVETKLFWVPAPRIPSYIDPAYGSGLSAAVQELVSVTRVGEIYGLMSHFRHLVGLLPLLDAVAGPMAHAFLSSDSDAASGSDFEARAWLHLLQQTRPLEHFRVVTLDLDKSFFDSFFSSMDRQPVLRVVGTDANSVTYVFLALWLSRAADQSTSSVHFIIAAELLNCIDNFALYGRLSAPLGVYQKSDVGIAMLTSYPAVPTAPPIRPHPLMGSVRFSESAESFRVECEMPQVWKAELQKGRILDARRPDRSREAKEPRLDPDVATVESESLESEWERESGAGPDWVALLDEIMLSDEKETEIGTEQCSSGWTLDVGLVGVGVRAGAAAGAGKGRKAGKETLCHVWRVAFPSPVHVDTCRILVSRNKGTVALACPKGRYVNQSGVRATLDPTDWLTLHASPLSQQNYVTLSGLQFTQEEKFVSRSRDFRLVPPLTNVKDSLMFFFQTEDEKYCMLSTDELGVVALIFRHVVRQDHSTGVPFADMSVCFLRHEFLSDVSPQWMKLISSTPFQRQIKLGPSELPLMRSFMIDYLGARMKVAPHHPDLPRWAKPHFKRRLVPLLLLQEVALNRDLMHEGGLVDRMKEVEHEPSFEEELEQKKQRGNALVGQDKFAAALREYRWSVVLYNNNKGTGEDEGGTPMLPHQRQGTASNASTGSSPRPPTQRTASSASGADTVRNGTPSTDKAPKQTTPMGGSKTTPGRLSPAAHQTAVACYLNIAHCLLKIAEPLGAGDLRERARLGKEAEVVCLSALGILEEEEVLKSWSGRDGCRLKALFRMGMALELQEKLEEALRRLGEAAAVRDERLDKTAVADAQQRITGKIQGRASNTGSK